MGKYEYEIIEFLNKSYFLKENQNNIGWDSIFFCNLAEPHMSILLNDGIIIKNNNRIELKKIGINYIETYRQNRVFKKIQLREINYIPNTKDRIEFQFVFDLFDQKDIKELETYISLACLGKVGFDWCGARPYGIEHEKEYKDLKKILLQYCIFDIIIPKVKNGTLKENESEEFSIVENRPRPYNQNRIIDIENVKFEFEIPPTS